MTVCPAGSATIYKCDGCGDTYKETDETFISNTHEYSFENGAILVNLIYENDNYFLGGTMTVKCAFCDAETVPEEKYDSIFEAIGYSMSEEESYIYHEIRVNKEAIKVYEEFSGKTIQYGVVAAVANDGKPLSIDAEGNLITAEQAVAADMTNSIYSKITIKLSGVPAGVGVNCNAFVIVDNTISYLCGNQILEAAETKIIPVPSEE